MENNKLLKEYEEIQRRRELWSNVIISRDKLFFTLAIGVFAYLGTQLPEFIGLSMEKFLFVCGGVLLCTLVLVWRGLSIHVDRQIVGMYQEEVDLERRLGFNNQTKYIYENLTKRSKEHIAKLMGEKQKELENWNYEKFSKAGENLKKRNCRDHYDCLIAVLQKFGYCSVGTRGHWIWHLGALLLIVFWLLISLWFFYCLNK